MKHFPTNQFIYDKYRSGCVALMKTSIIMKPETVLPENSQQNKSKLGS